MNHGEVIFDCIGRQYLLHTIHELDACSLDQQKKKHGYTKTKIFSIVSAFVLQESSFLMLNTY